MEAPWCWACEKFAYLSLHGLSVGLLTVLFAFLAFVASSLFHFLIDKLDIHMEYFLAGSVAGFAVDVTLYPLDTLKTRLQCREGFVKAGGFSGVYRGLSVVSVGSVPSAALFFGGYETSKTRLPFSCLMNQFCAATIAESVAALVRVPVDTVKQRMQAGVYSSMCTGTYQLVSNEGAGFLFRGLPITLLRDIPFAVAQMCIYEKLKSRDVAPWQCGLCGGAAAAFVTTPLDVIRTRVLLSVSKSPYEEFCSLLQEKRVQSFFRGATMRVTWISAGGAVFFSVYEKCKQLLTTT